MSSNGLCSSSGLLPELLEELSRMPFKAQCVLGTVGVRMYSFCSMPKARRMASLLRLGEADYSGAYLEGSPSIGQPSRRRLVRICQLAINWFRITSVWFWKSVTQR